MSEEKNFNDDLKDKSKEFTEESKRKCFRIC